MTLDMKKNLRIGHSAIITSPKGKEIELVLQEICLVGAKEARSAGARSDGHRALKLFCTKSFGKGDVKLTFILHLTTIFAHFDYIFYYFHL